MKKLVLFFSLFTYTLLLIPHIVLAANNMQITVANTITVTPKNDYLLAYPGMLPDNPLYKLKVIRDKIWEILITDPQKKVDFYLLQTDKQIGMVPLLVTNNEISLAKTTALKAEDNYTKLVIVYKNGATFPDAKTYKKLLEAADKHQQILMNVIKQVSNNDGKTFQQVINFSKSNVNSLTRLLPHTSPK